MIPGMEIQVQEDGEGGELCLVPQTAWNEISVAFVICTPGISGFKLHLPPGCIFLFADSLMVLGLVEFEKELDFSKARGVQASGCAADGIFIEVKEEKKVLETFVNKELLKGKKERF